MKRRLFLTGPIGCGKSTAILTALGGRIAQCGGFLTRRHREPYLHFTLGSPDGSFRKVFLDFSSGQPEIDLTAFSEITLQGSVLVLDEIGGMELLNPVFADTLAQVLNSDVPILGVLKGQGPAGAMIRRLELTAEYEEAAAKLWSQLRSNPETRICECGQYDENALLLARQWAEEYLHD